VTTTADLADAELARLYETTGIDLSGYPTMLTSEELAPLLRCTTGALANERYRGIGVPYIKCGRRVRYLRADVARYLQTRRDSWGAWPPHPPYQPTAGHRARP
jgi:hypothetical protein